jgi:Xaa-Pro aminopeptidase
MSKISKAEFKRRRKHLMAQMEPDSIAIIPSAAMHIRYRDTEYPFRQDSDFYYLTGFEEPDSVLVLIPGRKHGEYILFCQERHPDLELWTGYRAGPEGACSKYGADDAFPIGDIDDILPGLLEGRARVYYAMGRNSEFDQQLMQWVNIIRRKGKSSGAQPPGEFLDLSYLLHDQRLFKSAAEVRLMQEAADISVRAHIRAMQHCAAGLFEYQLEAELEHEFMRSGAAAPAYESIVGAGPNACILHYTHNRDKLKKGQLVLIDAGCELDHYASDITRTFPVGGRFSKEQRAIYDIVLEANERAIEAVEPGRPWNDFHQITVEIITQGLIDLGILKGSLKNQLKKEGYKRFYMHRAGHWLGMDVHDVGDYRVGEEWRELEPGMVLTVEPGIYIAPDDTSVAKKWRGIGVRIEDDVLVTKSGPRVLTSALPKSAKDIERIVQGKLSMAQILEAAADKGAV